MPTPLSFHLPKLPNHRLLVQTDRGPRFYPHLHVHPEYQITAVVRGSGVAYAGNALTAF